MQPNFPHAPARREAVRNTQMKQQHTAKYNEEHKNKTIEEQDDETDQSN
jgi:hypothetical protein